MPPKLKLACPELEAIVSRADNQECADCDARAPRWASVNLGCLVCIDCAGIHRHLGVHISVMKSVTLDKWQPKWLEVVGKLGNKTVNSYYEFRLADGRERRKPTSQASIETKRAYVIAKYERKEWCPKDSRSNPAPNELLAQGRDPEAYLNSVSSAQAATAGKNQHGRDFFVDPEQGRMGLAGVGNGSTGPGSANASARAAGGGVFTTGNSSSSTFAPNLLDDDFGNFGSSGGFNTAASSTTNNNGDFGNFAQNNSKPAAGVPPTTAPTTTTDSIDDLFAPTASAGGGNDFTAFASFPPTAAQPPSSFPSVQRQEPAGSFGGGGSIAPLTTASSQGGTSSQADKLASFNSNLANLYSSGTAHQNRGNMDAFGGLGAAFGGAGPSSTMQQPMSGPMVLGQQPMGAFGHQQQPNIMMGMGPGNGNPNPNQPAMMVPQINPTWGPTFQQQQQQGFQQPMMGGGFPVQQPAANMMNGGLGFPGQQPAANMMNGGLGFPGQQPAAMNGGLGTLGSGGLGNGYSNPLPPRKSGGLEDLVSGTVTSQYLNQFPGTPKNKSKSSPTGNGAGVLNDLDPFAAF